MLRILLKGRVILPFVWGISLLVASAPAWALTTGKLRIYVVDEDGFDLPNVQLTLSGENLIGGTQERFTDENGTQLFSELPPGAYTVSAVRAEFKGVTLSDVRVLVNQETTQKITLEEGAPDEEVEVVAGQAAVDTSKTTRGEVLTKEFLQNIPAGRTYQTAVATAAGVTGGGGNPNMAGAASNENTYMIDGADVTDPVTGTFSANFNFDAIQQIEVLLGGYMPEYGTSVGGIVNVVFESGTNNLEFDTNIFYTLGNVGRRMDERLSADGLELAPTDFDITQQAYTINSKVSGPLVRDKAWFLFSYSQPRNLSTRTGVPQARDFQGNYIFGKLTVQPSTEHRLSWSFQTDPTNVDNGNQGSPFVKAEAQVRQSQGGHINILKWQWFLSPDLNVDTTATIQKSFIEVGSVPCTHDRQRDWHPCRPDEAEGYEDWQTPGRVGQFGAFDSVNWGQYTIDDRFRYSLSSKLSVLSITDPLGGNHDFKFGIEGNQIVWDQISGFSGNTLYYDLNAQAFDPSSFSNYFWTEITGPIAFRTTGATYSAFAQDSWKPVSNLTVNWGSRVDNFVIRNDVGDPVIQGTLFGPRLFASWDPTNDQKTKIATGWGRFNDTGRLGVSSFTSVSGFGSKLYLGEFFADGEGVGFVNGSSSMYDYGPRENTNVRHDNLRNPRVDEVILTLEREILEDTAVYSSMSGKFTRYMYEADDVNFIYDSDGSAIIGSRNGDNLVSINRLRTPQLAKRDYFQWDLGVRKVFSQRWFMDATYTYTQSFGSSSQALSGSFLRDPQTQYNYGPLLTNLRHVVKARGFWEIPTDPWNQTIGVFLEGYEGFPIERLFWVDNWGGGVSGYGLRIRDRGTYDRFNFTWNLSAQFRQDIDVRKGKMFVTALVSNITNNRAPEIPFFGTVAATNRYQTLTRQSPMSFQIGAGYEY